MTRSLKPYLEMTADKLESVLAAHRAPGHITGGSVGPARIRMVIQPAPHVRFAAIKSLADDLALAIRVPHVLIERDADGIVLEYTNPDRCDVDFAHLLAELTPFPAATALLGQQSSGVPLLASLASPNVAHILIAGTTGSGKSVLLRGIATSLAHANTPNALRLLIIDAKGRLGTAFGGLPHLARLPLTTGDEILEALRSLIHLMELRDKRRESAPRVVVIIDELADVIMTAPGSEILITRLAQRGREAGIHLIAATQRPSAAILSGLMRANFPLRIVGRVVSADDARIASGRAATNAHLLAGRGDFIAVAAGDAPIRFQAPKITDADITKLLGTTTAAPRPIAALPAPTAEAGHTDMPVDIEAPAIPEQAQTAVNRLRPNWEQLRAQLETGALSKSALVREIWGDDKKYAGSHAKWLNQAIEMLNEAAAPIEAEPVIVDWPFTKTVLAA